MCVIVYNLVVRAMKRVVKMKVKMEVELICNIPETLYCTVLCCAVL